MLLKVESLDVQYGSAKVLHNVSLNVKKGELVCIVGRNGAGKTTLLKTIAGFLNPTKGKIIYQDALINGLRPDKVALLGIKYVFQDKRVFGDLTVRDNIQLAAYPTKADVEQAVERLFKISEKMRRLIDTKAKGLSGGERQILLIGRSLVGNPSLLLIDEPTEGLAAKVIDEIARILMEMKGLLSMIIVEQNLAIVSRMADRVYIMKEGSMLKEITDREQINEQSYIESLL
ncbi:MAG TPA: ATP-binding cassette domain-containing protein [Syntrophorhabdaceae bacterium]|nr:ATP-binding cassette domain-containing protein [Syntrophorhabdaceae bacterium]